MGANHSGRSANIASAAGDSSLERRTLKSVIRNDSGAEQSYLQQMRRRFPDSPEFAELTEKKQ